MQFFRLTFTLFATFYIALSLTGATARAGTRLHNRTQYDLWLAQGFNKDSSIAGIGGNGWDDPNTFIRAHGWKKLPSGGSIETNATAVLIAAFNNGQMKVIRPAKPSKYAHVFPFSRKKFDAKIPYGGPTMSGPNVNNRRSQAIRSRGYDTAVFYRVRAYQERHDRPAIVGNQATNRELRDWFRQTARKSGISTLRVRNNTGRKMLFKVKFITTNGSNRSFNDFKEIASGASGVWQLNVNQNGDFRYGGGRVAVGIEAVDPFSNQRRYWGIENGAVTSLNASRREIVNGNTVSNEYSVSLSW